MVGGPYYRHSGKAPVPGMAAGLVAGVASAIVFAAVYAYAILYIPIVGTVTFILTGLVAFGAGAVTAAVLKRGRVRSNLAATAVGTAVGFVALWAAWVFWVYAFLRQQNVDVSVIGVALSPDALWSVILKVNEVGAWSFKGSTPTGIVLWVLWFVEALIIAGGVAFVTYAAIAAEPFCEGCQTWCVAKENVGQAAMGDAARLKAQLESGDLRIFEELGPVPEGASEWLRWDIHSCPSCGETNTLTVKAMKLEIEKGKAKTSDSTVVDQLLLARDQVGPMMELGNRLTAAPAAPAPATA